MRLKNHKVLMIVVLMGIALINGPAMATDVGGIIDIDTTWDFAGSPYNLLSNVQVAEGITLTIQSGVTVNGSNNRIEVFGMLNAMGEPDSIISFNNLNILTQSNGIFNITFSDLNSKSRINLGSSGFGILNISNSTVRNGSYINLHQTGGDCFIERNIFIDADSIYVGTRQSHNLFIRNNVFYEQRNGSIIDSGNSGQTIVQYNSFLSTDRIALSLEPNRPSAEMIAIENFWNTTDSGIIDSMIYDRKDDLNVANIIEYTPFLTEPHSDTPTLPFNQSPNSSSGMDKVVFDEVILDGSASYDSDGTIVSYYWSLQHRTFPENDKTATGINPTITGLSNGFYDVCLTVTDDLGATDIDCSLLAAAGSCFSTADTMHVESILPGTFKAKYGKVTVTIFDNSDNPVPDAEVTGDFSGDFNETGSGVTDANGTAVIYTTAEFKKASYKFCVTNVVKESLTYEPMYNVETCDSK